MPLLNDGLMIPEYRLWITLGHRAKRKKKNQVRLQVEGRENLSSPQRRLVICAVSFCLAMNPEEQSQSHKTPAVGSTISLSILRKKYLLKIRERND